MAGEIRLAGIMPGIVAFQALYRGYRTRKAMKAIREEFLLILNDVESNFSDRLEVVWHPSFAVCRPSIQELSKCRKEDTHSSEKGTTIINEKDTCNDSTAPSLLSEEISGEAPERKSPRVEIAERNEDARDNQNCSQGFDSASNVEQNKNLVKTEDSFSDSIIQAGLNGHECEDSVLHTRTDRLDYNHNREDRVIDDEGLLKDVSYEKLRSMKKKDILEKREEIQMELLWIQQAIDSRKQYIKLKG